MLYDLTTCRFKLDNIVQRLSYNGSTLYVNLHLLFYSSMEECEALCTRLAVMVNGQFKCLGSPQHLKNKFSEGYILIVTVSPSEDGGKPDPAPLAAFIENKFPGCYRKDMDQRMVHYHITDTSLTLAQIFGTMEAAKKPFNIQDYSVSQTTLEQVFINFARAQIPPVEVDTRCCRGFCLACSFCSSCCGSKREVDPQSSRIRYDSNAPYV